MTALWRPELTDDEITAEIRYWRDCIRASLPPKPDGHDFLKYSLYLLDGGMCAALLKARWGELEIFGVPSSGGLQSARSHRGQQGLVARLVFSPSRNPSVTGVTERNITVVEPPHNEGVTFERPSMAGHMPALSWWRIGAYVQFPAGYAGLIQAD
jgi:hypothetical protein